MGSLEFKPPLVRPVARGRSPPFGGSPPCGVPSGACCPSSGCRPANRVEPSPGRSRRRPPGESTERSGRRGSREGHGRPARPAGAGLAPDVEDAARHSPIIHSGLAPGLRKSGPQPLHLLVPQPEPPAHATPEVEPLQSAKPLKHRSYRSRAWHDRWNLEVLMRRCSLASWCLTAGFVGSGGGGVDAVNASRRWFRGPPRSIKAVGGTTTASTPGAALMPEPGRRDSPDRGEPKWARRRPARCLRAPPPRARVRSPQGSAADL